MVLVYASAGLERALANARKALPNLKHSKLKVPTKVAAIVTVGALLAMPLINASIYVKHAYGRNWSFDTSFRYKLNDKRRQIHQLVNDQLGPATILLCRHGSIAQSWSNDMRTLEYSALMPSNADVVKTMAQEPPTYRAHVAVLIDNSELAATLLSSSKLDFDNVPSSFEHIKTCVWA